MRSNVYRTGSRTISIVNGTEGPTHDPYSYTEISVKRKGFPEITLHFGLAVWMAYGKTRVPTEIPENMLWKMLEVHLGCTWASFQRALRKLHSKCRVCGSLPCQEVAGYPGETFLLCKNGHVIDSHFNEGAVI